MCMLQASPTSQAPGAAAYQQVNVSVDVVVCSAPVCVLPLSCIATAEYHVVVRVDLAVNYIQLNALCELLHLSLCEGNQPLCGANVIYGCTLFIMCNKDYSLYGVVKPCPVPAAGPVSLCAEN
jgi:hypothetical protein